MKSQEFKAKEREANRLIWYNFGIRAKRVLEVLEQVQLDNIDIRVFDKVQIESKAILADLEKALIKFQADYPD